MQLTEISVWSRSPHELNILAPQYEERVPTYLGLRLLTSYIFTYNKYVIFLLSVFRSLNKDTYINNVIIILELSSLFLFNEAFYITFIDYTG